MIEKQFIELFPWPLPRGGNSLFRQWVEAHQDILSDQAETVEAVAMSNRILDASGKELDLIGDQFGRIGRRRGRGDEQYRAFLLSIVPSFQGRGTPTGLKFAIGAGVQARADEIGIEEFFDDLEYSVTVGDWIAHDVETVHELADLADPSGVQLRPPITYDYERSGIGITANNTSWETRVTTPGGVGIEAHSSTGMLRGVGFGAGRFEGDDAFGEPSPFDPQREDSYGAASYGDASFEGSTIAFDADVDDGETMTIDDDESVTETSAFENKGAVDNSGELNNEDE